VTAEKDKRTKRHSSRRHTSHAFSSVNRVPDGDRRRDNREARAEACGRISYGLDRDAESNGRPAGRPLATSLDRRLCAPLRRRRHRRKDQDLCGERVPRQPTDRGNALVSGSSASSPLRLVSPHTVVEADCESTVSGHDVGEWRPTDPSMTTLGCDAPRIAVLCMTGRFTVCPCNRRHRSVGLSDWPPPSPAVGPLRRKSLKTPQRLTKRLSPMSSSSSLELYTKTSAAASSLSAVDEPVTRKPRRDAALCSGRWQSILAVCRSEERTVSHATRRQRDSPIYFA